MVEKVKLTDLLTKNNSANKINWIGTHDELISIVNEWYDHGLIQFVTGQDTKDYCLQHFLIKGKDIKKGTIGNAATKQGTRYNS